jgi:hypothetical protein
MWKLSSLFRPIGLEISKAKDVDATLSISLRRPAPFNI